MKFRRLSIANIASIESAVIDFDREPLASADVFLIGGVTGAGKSTILDAVCLALFNAVPRLGSGRSSDRFNGMSCRDYKQLLRTGTAEGYVELTFRGNNGHEYEARWRVWQTAKKINSQWTLIPDGDRTKALVKEKLIEAEISAALNIDYEQFVRTSLLAQGEFTRFLNSDDADKAKILEKLTGGGRFAEVGREIFRVYSEKLAAERTLKDQSQVVTLLSSEQIDGIKSEIAARAADAESQKALAARIDVKLQWLLRRKELQQLCDESARSLKYAMDCRDSREMVEARAFVADYDLTSSVRVSMGAAGENRRLCSQIEVQLSSLRPKWSVILASINQLRESRKIYGAEADALARAIEAYAERADAFEFYEGVIAAVEGIMRGRSDAARIAGEASAGREALPKVRESLARSEEALRCAGEKAAACAAAAAEARARFAAMDVAAVLEAFAVASDSLQSFNILERMASVEAALMKAKAEADSLEGLVKRSRKHFEELDFGHKEWAAIARASLYEGCTCPVCRQKVATRLPAEELLNNQWLNAKKALEEDLDALAAAQKLVSSLDAQLTELSRSHSALSHRLDAIPMDSSRREAMKKALENSHAEAKRAEAEIATVKSLSEKTQNAYIAALKDKETAEKVRAGAAQAVSAAEASLTTLDEKARQTLAGADAELEALLAKPYMKAWTGPGNFDPAVFVADFRAAYRDLDSLKQRRRRLMTAIETADTRLAAAADAIDVVAESLPEWNDTAPADTVSDADVFAFLGSFVSKVSSCAERRRHVLAEIARLDTAVEQFLEDNSRFTPQSLAALFRADESALEKTRARVAEADRSCTCRQAAFESAKVQMTEHESAKPEMTDEDTLEALRESKSAVENHIAELNRSAGALVQQLQNDAESRSRQEALIGRLAAAARESERWGRLNNLFGDKEGNRFRNIALSFVLENLLVAANRYLAMLTDRYRLRGVEGTYLILLEDAYNGYRSRPVVTSSGGESFMVSLSLALALADFGSSFVADTLFIDEGFGTLSGEPLQRAVGMLRSLNRSSGRRVGIISHIAELKAELPVQILVDADPSRGASTVSVTDSAR